MTHSTSVVSPITVGLDVGDRRTHFRAVNDERKVVARGSFPTASAPLAGSLEPFAGARVVLEAGSQSPWMSRVLRGHGYEVQVADPRRVQLISKDPRKTDRRDRPGPLMEGIRKKGNASAPCTLRPVRLARAAPR
jgi:transposase